jgi:acyl-homoserine-lactone acylase
VALRRGDKAYALKSASIDEYRFVEQWNLMGKARTLDEFRRALDMQALPMFNICYADKEGNCFYLFNGRFPDRPAGYNWAGVVPGNTSATEWNRLLPQSRLPSLVNPPGGYVQNCNSAPWYTNLRQILDRHQFPPDLTPNFNDLRQQHSLEMLDNDRRFSLEDVKQAKNTMKLLLADRVKKDVIQLAQASSKDGGSLDEAARVLEAWDNTVARDSRGSVLFVDFWRKYAKDSPSPFAVAWDERKPASTPHGIRDKEKARQALTAAVRDVKERYGSLSVPWGDVYRLRRGKLDVPVGGLTGEFGAFRIIGYDEQKDGKFVALGGDSYVLAVEFTTPPTAYTILAYSQSDDPRSPHHTDQTELFAQEKWKRAWFTEEDIAKNLKRSYHP